MNERLRRVARENLALWRQAACENRELRLLQAEALGRAAGEDYLADRLADPRTAARDLLSIPAEECAALSAPDDFALLLTTGERLAFCRTLAGMLPRGWEEEPSASEPLPPAAAHRVACVDSPFTKAAIQAFARVENGLIPLTLPSFSHVLEETAAGNAAYALLPLEDSREGRLLHLYRQIERYELHIAYDCSLAFPEEEGERTFCFALLRRGSAAPDGKIGRGMLACTLAADDDPRALTELLAAAGACGLTLSRLDSIPAPAREGAFLYHPVFAVGKAGDAVFDLYLNLFLPHARIIERYRRIS